MSIAVNLANLANEVNSQGVLGATKISASVGGGPKITSIVVTNSSYTTLDDTAVSLSGGYIKILGSGFASGCQVLINTVTATSVTFVSSTEVRAQVPATAAGTYVVYLVNTDGGVAIRVNGLSFSSTPTWTTSSSLDGTVNSAISLQLAATGAATYALAAGSSLPSGVALSSGGLLSGTVTGISIETTYNFTVVATDAELQDSPQAFSLTIGVGEPLFRFNTLLLSGNGTNNQTNSTFIDSSTNNFTVTRSGNATQGTFSPYGAGWSNYFDGSGDYLTVPYSASTTQWWDTDYTIEMWILNRANAQSGTNGLPLQVAYGIPTSDATFWSFGTNSSGNLYFYYYNGGAVTNAVSTATVSLNQWVHVAMVYTNSTTTLRGYINGAQAFSVSKSGTPQGPSGYTLNVGLVQNAGYNGYISNLRIVRGTAVYTTAFTPITTPLQPIANTSLLTCADPRFVDDSGNNFAITRNGDVSVQKFSPFKFAPAYTPAVYGGSMYFDGTGDHLIVPAITPTAGNATVEFWIYPAATQVYIGDAFIVGTTDNSAGTWAISLSSNNTIGVWIDSYGSIRFVSTTAVNRTTWNHIALVKTGGIIYLYVNGVQQASTYSQAGTFGRNATIHIGQYSAGGQNFTGHISNLRIVYGTAVYTTNFTPPTTPLTAISNTNLLLSGTNAGIIDAAMLNNFETVGDAKISTAQSKFGGSSILFDGAGDRLVSIPSPVNILGNSDFTIEFWLYPTNTGSGYRALVSSENYPSTTGGWSLYQFGSTIEFWITAVGGASLTGSSVLSAGTWQHLALSRASGTLRLFINGTSVTSVSNSTSFTGQQIWIGDNNSSGGGLYMYNGYIDDLRITRGVARYTTNFTAPTLAHITQ